MEFTLEELRLATDDFNPERVIGRGGFGEVFRGTLAMLERTPLDWPTRKRIALGAARGICSLHELRIVHRDVKPSNILLDEEF
ncbi:hypothetical protein MLD38_021114 [Melastoma candidum]|uniref:Uncharacterized protein n=1 Tax=Melastoma candidum TaxID=119954 RepID=A0ACB9QF48_9MYRT|nr:hypothetical protein MLD38_021114 [Melastoma candidum]